MKVALVIDDSLDRPDGVQQYVIGVGAYLASAGHDVHYVCSDASRTDLAGTLHSLVDNIPVTFNGNGLRIPRIASRRLLREFIARERFDVIHVQMPHSPLFSARLVRQARRVQGGAVAIVGTFHILPVGRVAAVATRLLGLLLRRNLGAFDRFCAVSAPAADFARRVVSHRIDRHRQSDRCRRPGGRGRRVRPRARRRRRRAASPSWGASCSARAPSSSSRRSEPSPRRSVPESE